MQTVPFVVFIGMLVAPAQAQLDQGLFGSTEPRPGPVAYTLEGLGAVGTGVLFALVPSIVTATQTLDDDWSYGEGWSTSLIAWGCVTAAAYSAGSAAGAGWVGQALHWDGSPAWSYGLAFVPAVVVGSAAIIGKRVAYSGWRDASIWFLIAGAPVLATVGYNRQVSPGGYGYHPGRFLPPSLAARFERQREAGERPGVTVDARLLTVRF
ncbi:MAG TPA: hypothetical protein VMH22_08265 [bacterium]|nr:hypothetical protein [bacterium]